MIRAGGKKAGAPIGLALLVVLWLVLLLVGLRWFTAHPRRTVVLPVVGFVVWLGAVALAVAAAG